jgi:DnaJ-class molecular chaperone
MNDFDECRHCDGSGKDPTEWDGRCIYCGGKGDVSTPDLEDDEDVDLDLCPVARGLS